MDSVDLRITNTLMRDSMQLVCVLDAFYDLHEMTADHTMDQYVELCDKVYGEFGGDISDLLEENIMSVVRWRVAERLQTKALCEAAATK